MQLKIHDYKLTGIGRMAWAYVEVFGKDINIEFTKYDAITAAIELGFMEEPTDRDETRVGYEKTAFSATVREVWPWEHRVAYQDNDTYLSELSGTDFAEQIVIRLALQSTEVREVIQVEAHRIALAECPVGMVDAIDLKKWFEVFHKEISSTGSAVNYAEISEYMKQSYYAAEQETLSQLQ